MLNEKSAARAGSAFRVMVEGEGFEPSKAEPSDLQSDPFGHSGTPPRNSLDRLFNVLLSNTALVRPENQTCLFAVTFRANREPLHKCGAIVAKLSHV